MRIHRIPHTGLAGADLIFQWIGMVEYIPCYGAPATHWGLLPVTRLASRKILSKISKSGQGQHSVYSVGGCVHVMRMYRSI